jgi:hypothetical protein
VPASSGRLMEWLRGLPSPVRVAYEAGPTGFELARACERVGIACLVAAPGRIPRAAADRVKTDRRDAERLARLLRLGELTRVRVPSELEEAARDLVRTREDARADLMRARHRLSKLLWRGTGWSGSARSGRASTTAGWRGCVSRASSPFASTSAIAVCSLLFTWPYSGRQPSRINRRWASQGGSS